MSVSEVLDAWIASQPADESGAVTTAALTDAIPSLVASLGTLITALGAESRAAER